MLRILIAVYFLILPAAAFAGCDFNTSLFARELEKPEAVQTIDIEIKKSKKWAMNGIRMVIDNQQNIHPKWKKRFSGTVRVTYRFGTCTYSADIRQSGDWRDHLEFRNGQLRQSLDVELEDGNIAGVVDFKLLLPETRLGNNETLAALILRKLDILAPKTFMVDVTVNGIAGPYLFQEKESKELLEAMGRREGPMFEGDETLLWSYEDFRTFELTPVSGARLVNHKWARRGESSGTMALNAFQELQYHYVNFSYADYGGQFGGNDYFLNPNERLDSSRTFQEYHAIVAALSGLHGLTAHNRKFYWNALAGEFEPLYYDGNVKFEVLDPVRAFRKRPFELERFRDHLSRFDFSDLTARIHAMEGEQFLNEFALLAKLSTEDARTFLAPRFDVIITNLELWNNFVSEPSVVDLPEPDYPTARSEFVKKSEAFGVKQRFAVYRQDKASDGLAFDCQPDGTCDMAQVTIDQLVDLMSDHVYQDQRIVILPSGDLPETGGQHVETSAGPFTVRHSVGAKAIFDQGERELVLHQTRADDWFLIRNTEMRDVTVTLIGREPVPRTGGAQWFNEFGLTGCLTFYKVSFEHANIRVSDGGCEDSLNLVSSRGSLDTLEISNGFADAIDLDFSQITIRRVSVDQAGNDCLDVSGGEYAFAEASFMGCGDKGISVGESSSMTGERVDVDTAGIAASSKDYSDLTIAELSVKDVWTCLEAFQKKSEFGGATINIARENCDRSKISHDQNSMIILGGAHFELSN
jgi:hypothetical protein